MALLLTAQQQTRYVLEEHKEEKRNTRVVSLDVESAF